MRGHAAECGVLQRSAGHRRARGAVRESPHSRTFSPCCLEISLSVSQSSLFPTRRSSASSEAYCGIFFFKDIMHRQTMQTQDLSPVTYCSFSPTVPEHLLGVDRALRVLESTFSGVSRMTIRSHPLCRAVEARSVSAPLFLVAKILPAWLRPCLVDQACPTFSEICPPLLSEC